MRILIDQKSYDEMLSKTSHPRDCYVRGAEYLHHLYVDGVKYLVARAVYDCIKRAQETADDEALLHLLFHKEELERMVAEARGKGVDLRTTRAIGDPPPTDAESRPQLLNSFTPREPQTIEETGLNRRSGPAGYSGTTARRSSWWAWATPAHCWRFGAKALWSASRPSIPAWSSIRSAPATRCSRPSSTTTRPPRRRSSRCGARSPSPHTKLARPARRKGFSTRPRLRRCIPRSLLPRRIPRSPR